MGRRRAVAIAPISNRDTLVLLKSWGFTEERGNGGHLVLALNGRNVQITAPGRNTPTPYKALRKAAAIVGVNLQDLLGGPKKEKVMSATSEATIAAPLGATGGTSQAATAVADPPKAKAQPQPTQAVTFACPSCERTFDNLKSVRVHQRSHNMVKCRNCNTKMAEPARGPHEKFCVLKNPEGPLALQRAVAVTKVEAEAPTPPRKPRGRPRGSTKKAMAARKAARKAPAAKKVAVARPVAPVSVPNVTGGSDTMDALIGLLFPSGIPSNLSAVTALNEWMTATERLLDASKS